MNEPDPGAVCPRTRHLVEQLGAGRAGLRERCSDIIGGIGDVVNGLTAILEELLHFGVRIERHDQLDPALADRDHGDLDAFGLESLPSGRPQPQAALVDPNRLVEIADSDPDMVDPAQHGVDSKPRDFLARLTRYGPFVVGLTTASYVTVRLPLFTPRPLRPIVDGASDPTEGRRLDRESHRWRDLASNRRGRSDLRFRLRRARVSAATAHRGVGRRRRRAADQSDRTYGRANPAPNARRGDHLRPRNAGADPYRRPPATSGGATHGAVSGKRPLIGRAADIGRCERLW